MSENETTYHLENAPSGRAKCKKCKETIAKGELRIATNAAKEGADFKLTSYNHPRCFVVPPRAMKGVSPEEFVDSHLEDQTNDGDYLTDETKRQEIVDAIAFKPPRASKGGGGTKVDGKDGDESSAVGKRIAEIRAAAEALADSGDDSDDDGARKRPAKKAKKSKGGEYDVEACARAMKAYYGKMKADDLKSVIRWNLGYGVTGTKDVLLLRCIDGHVNGRLARCPSCFKGKLVLDESDAGSTVVCRGYFDEDTQVRIPCAYSAPASDAPRLAPWYPEEPSEEETEAMKAITEKHEAMGSGRGGGGGDVPQGMIDAVENLDWPMDDVKEAASAMVAVCTSGEVKVDLPQDEKRRRMAVGKLLVGLRRDRPDATAVETLKAIVKEFGVAQAKEEAKARQKSAMAGSCKVAANAGIAQAFQELGELYFKEGNSNAGMSYKKAVAAIAAIDYEITADNAKALCKGKTKVAGIGKGSADKIHEFLATGSIQKLEEKRQIHS